MFGFSTLTTWAIGAGVAAVVLGYSHWSLYDKGYANGGNAERIYCQQRIDKANQEAAKREEQWKEGLTAVLEAATKAAAEDDVKNADLQKKLDEYTEQILTGGGELCPVTDDDVNKLR